MSTDKQTPGGMLGVTMAGKVNTVAVLSAESAMECLQAGEIVIPCSIEECRELWGQQVMEPIYLRGVILQNIVDKAKAELAAKATA